MSLKTVNLLMGCIVDKNHQKEDELSMEERRKELKLKEVDKILEKYKNQTWLGGLWENLWGEEIRPMLEILISGFAYILGIFLVLSIIYWILKSMFE